jgi:hypothetical protein
MSGNNDITENRLLRAGAYQYLSTGTCDRSTLVVSDFETEFSDISFQIAPAARVHHTEKRALSSHEIR